MREVGEELGLRWSQARLLVEAAGLDVLDGGTPRRWYVRRDAWEELRRRVLLKQCGQGVA